MHGDCVIAFTDKFDIASLCSGFSFQLSRFTDEYNTRSHVITPPAIVSQPACPSDNRIEMASQQVSNRYQLRDSDRNALLVLLEDDASRAGFVADVTVPTIDDCDGDCTTKAVSTSETLASCAFTDRLRELSQATYGPSQYSVNDSSDITRRLSLNRMS